MHKTIENLNYIQNQINSKLLKLNLNNYMPKIIAISKTFKIDHLMPLIDHGHSDFGENKVQEAINKWTEIKNKNKNIKLHMVGKLVFPAALIAASISSIEDIVSIQSMSLPPSFRAIA